jgi:hypothetical protein
LLVLGVLTGKATYKPRVRRCGAGEKFGAAKFAQIVKMKQFRGFGEVCGVKRPLLPTAFNTQ